MFQNLVQQRVTVTKQEQESILKTQRLLDQVGRALEALEVHVVAVSNGSATDRHGTNVALVAQCNFLNGQAALAAMRGDEKGLAIGLERVAKHEETASKQDGLADGARSVLNNYYGYMEAVLRGDAVEALPSVPVRVTDDSELVANQTFETILGSMHGASENSRRMANNVEALRDDHAAAYSKAEAWQRRGSGRDFDPVGMTGHMNRGAIGYSGLKEMAREEVGDDVVMGDVPELRLVPGCVVSVRGSSKTHRVQRVGSGHIFLEDGSRLVRVARSDVKVLHG